MHTPTISEQARAVAAGSTARLPADVIAAFTADRFNAWIPPLVSSFDIGTISFSSVGGCSQIVGCPLIDTAQLWAA